MTTTAAPAPEARTCPAWCIKHPTNDPEAHQSATWREYGLSLMIEQDGATPEVFVSHGVHQSLDLTPEQAHELGMALVRAADVLRRARTEGQR